MNTKYSMDCVDPDHYIHLSLHGVLMKSISLKFFDGLLDTLQSSAQTRVLIDTRDATVETSIINALSCAEKVSRITPRKRVALLLLPVQRSLGENNELVYGNRGLPVRYFLNEENALSWLTAGNLS